MAWIKEKLKLAGQWILFILQALLIWGILCFVLGYATAGCYYIFHLPKYAPETAAWTDIYLVIFFIGAFIMGLVQYVWHKPIFFNIYAFVGTIINFAIIYNNYAEFSFLSLTTDIFYIAYPFLTPTN